MNPEQSQDAFDAYANLIRLTAMQNPESIPEIVNGLNSNPNLTANQKEALSAYAHVELQCITLNPSTNPLTGTEASHRSGSFSGGGRR